ncbi:MAG: hypothetical protein JNK23_09470 [Opitutaceae bacterium]|nr:hypothetical protein [Opitutaceae bacterium]
MRRLLPLLLLASLLPQSSAVPPAPRHGEKLVVINDDGFSGFFEGRYRNAEDLRAQVLRFRDTPVAVLEWCIVQGSRTNFPSRAVELVGAGQTEFGRRGDQLVTETYRRLAAEGIDTLQTVARACREAGILCYASMRMNGDYSPTGSDPTLPRQFNGDFWHAHPEFRVRDAKGTPGTKLSYAFAEVRAHKLAHLREAAARDIDGLHLDFLRHPPFFGYDEPLVHAFREKHGVDPRTLPASDARWIALRAEAMTGFVRDVRALLDEAGAKKGRRLGLAARIDHREYLALGCDLAAWLREGLLDYVAIAQRTLGGYEFDLAPFVALARGSGCAVLFGEEAITTGHDLTAAEDKLVAAGKMAPPKRGQLTPDQYRGRAARWFAAGADGLHLFNENDPAVLRGLSAVTASPKQTTLP